MRRILFASWYTGFGGGETDLFTLARDLDASRFVPELLVPRRGQLSEAWEAAGWAVHVVSYRGATTWFVPFIWARLPAVGRMRRVLDADKFDVIHSDYHTLPLIAPAARAAGVPVMWTVHGWWFRPKLWQRRFFRQIPAVARSFAIRDGFLGDPPFMSRDALPVIYSGVDTERFHPAVDGSEIRAEIDIAPDAPLVAMVARFQSVKGHLTFQDMARDVAQRLPDVHFIVAGEDVFGVSADRDYKAQVLQRAADDPILSQRLHYIGFRDDVQRVYAAADVVVCASDFESYGKANLEAMSCGTPVVSTNRGGPTETVLDGETGFLVPPRDAVALAEHVAALLGDADLRRKMGEAGRRHVEQNFSAQAAATRYTTEFLKLL